MRDCVVFTTYEVGDDARVSRSSRGKKSVVGGDAVEGQKLVGTVVRLRAPCIPFIIEIFAVHEQAWCMRLTVNQE